MSVSTHVARDVLGALNVIDWHTGSFTTSLVNTFMKADMHNFYLLSSAFPDVGEAVDMYKNQMNGYDELMRIAKI